MKDNYAMILFYFTPGRMINNFLKFLCNDALKLFQILIKKPRYGGSDLLSAGN